MDVNTSADLKFQSNQFSDRSSATVSGIPWFEKRLSKIRKRHLSMDREWGPDRSPTETNKEESKADEGKEKVQDDIKQTPTASTIEPISTQSGQNTTIPTTHSTFTYGYTAPPDSFNVDPNRRAFPMMPPPCSYFPWPVNSMDMAANMPGTPGMPVAGGLEMPPNGNAGMNPYNYLGMTGDPSMYGMMGGMGNYCPYPLMNGQENVLPTKEVFQFESCVLVPPNPSAPPPTTREKPPGCKTVFAGGLPEKITEDIIREVFSKFGEIVTIRMSKKNFCHIRFSAEMYVDSALFLSGYRIKIENKDEAAYSGRMHVDYAIARDDQYEYECAQRALQREQRHREQLEQQNFRPPTPPPIVHYSEHEVTTLAENLRSESSFKKAVQILITWLERGECNKKNAGYFYSMIQSTNSHVRRLMNDKAKYEDELNKARMMLRQKMSGISLQFLDIEKVFDAAKLQKVWDHFTKPQRKNIELWQRQTLEIKKANSDELIDDRIEDEMEVSDGEESSEDKAAKEKCTKMEEDNNQLKEEIDSLRNQIRTMLREIEVIKNDSEQSVNVVRKSYHTCQQKLIETQRELDECKKTLKNKKTFVNPETVPESERHVDNGPTTPSLMCSRCCYAPDTKKITDNETRTVALISTFLHVHPFGASVDYICSFLDKTIDDVDSREVENLMKRFPTVFKENTVGIGATLRKEWTFLGFMPRH